MKILYEPDGKGNINILIPEGKTMLLDGEQVPAPNWSCSISMTDTEALSEYLTPGQIESLSGAEEINESIGENT